MHPDLFPFLEGLGNMDERVAGKIGRAKVATFVRESEEIRRKTGTNQRHANLTLTESEGLIKLKKREDIVVSNRQVWEVRG